MNVVTACLLARGEVILAGMPLGKLASTAVKSRASTLMAVGVNMRLETPVRHFKWCRGPAFKARVRAIFSSLLL
jgi:hypothetical protein